MKHTEWAVEVSEGGGRVFVTPKLTDDQEAALDAAWENDPTKSKSRYYKFRRAMLDPTQALEAAGFRYGKPHWCGGSRVLYSIESWEQWDKANPACPVADPPMSDRRLVALEREEPTCRTCNGPVRGRSDTRYCSNACRQRAYRKRKEGEG